MRAVLFALITLLPAASASPLSESPMGLDLRFVDGQWILTWQKPVDWNPDEYQIFIDGEFFAATDALSLVVTEAHTYVVRALSDHQSSSAFLVVSPLFDGGAESDGPLDCGYVTTNTNMSKPPFIFVRVHPGCLYWIEELISGGATMDFRLIHWSNA